MRDQGVIRGLVVGILGLAVLVGCSTTTTTTAELTYLHSPVRIDPAGTSTFRAGASVLYEVDRGQTRLGLCGVGGYEWWGDESSVTDSDALIPNNLLMGSYCYKQDIG